MRVRAARAGYAVPKQHNPREHIGEKAVEVPDNSYYRRLVAFGDLEQVKDGADDAQATTTDSTPSTDATASADAPPTADQKPAKTQRKNRSAE